MTRRIFRYVVEMYPLHVNVPYSFMLFYGYYLLLQAVYGFPQLLITWESVLGACTLAAFTLLLRVFDELKDYEHDVRLFPDRPLPSGRVTHRDLTWLAGILIALMVALNVTLGAGFAGFLILLGYGLLMLRFFFLPELHRRSLLLTLATHNPVAFFTHLYVFSVFMQDHRVGLDWIPPGAWLGILMFWGLIFSWETARKIRAPEEETEYVTYSQIVGTRRAPWVPMIGLTVSFGLAVYFGLTLELSYVFAVVMVLAWTFSMRAFIRFLETPSPQTSKLRPYVETSSLVLYAAFLVALPVKLGAIWVGPY